MGDLDLVLRVQSAIVGWGAAEFVAVFLARALVMLVPVAAFVAWACSKRGEDRAAVWHAIAEAAWSVGLALLLVNAIGTAVGRLRPFEADPRVVRLVPAPVTSSYPSGHTASAVAMAVAFWRFRRSAGAMAGAAAALVAFGRLAAGVHYPTDLMAGAAVGASAAFVTSWGHGQLRRLGRPASSVF